MEQRQNKTLQASQVTDLVVNLPDRPDRPRKPSSYDLLKSHNPKHRLVVEYDDALAVFNAYWDNITFQSKKASQIEEKKKLAEVEIKSVYQLFKIKFFEANGKPFDPDANSKEALNLVYSLLYYFFRNPNFLNSPLLNSDINEPDMRKGLLVIGGFGCGKTSIFKAFRKMLFDAKANTDVVVKDIDGDDVSLGRYQRMFGYFTANEVVRQYESCIRSEDKERFWRNFSKGEIYFDDLMTEEQASNYGKTELFKSILEVRYDKTARTLASTNYNGNTNETLTAMGHKYGSRVYDRLFEMFNIIELKGQSLRK